MEELRYTVLEQSRFVSYFKNPKRKRGRPKKKKRGRSARTRTKRALTDERRKKNTAIAREKAFLVKAMEGALAVERQKVLTRINWDTPGRKELRKRIANSWTNKTDMYRDGESFAKYCVRVGIHVNSLRRFLKAKGQYKSKKRGRKPFLKESVMRHICEGNMICN